MRYPPWSGNFHKIVDWATQNSVVVILRAMVPGHGQGEAGPPRPPMNALVYNNSDRA